MNIPWLWFRSSLIHFACIGVAPFDCTRHSVTRCGEQPRCRQNGSKLNWKTWNISTSGWNRFYQWTALVERNYLPGCGINWSLSQLCRHAISWDTVKHVCLVAMANHLYSNKGAARSFVAMKVKCTDWVHVKKIFIRSSLCRQRCEKHDVNIYNQNINIIHISIQPHFDQYTTSLSDNPLPKVIALVMASGFILT